MLLPIEAEKELEVSSQMNPGQWVRHSRSVAENAKLIAAQIESMDESQAYVMGLLHDIGRRAGNKALLHTFDGYDYMYSINQPKIARICLTHSFPIQDIHTFFGRFDCTQEQKEFLENYLKQVTYDEYDRLIQLCDAISLPNGACIMEKRLVDVALRHGLPECTIEKWKAFMELKKHFDKLCGCNIYTLLPNVMQNSYSDLI